MKPRSEKRGGGGVKADITCNSNTACRTRRSANQSAVTDLIARIMKRRLSSSFLSLFLDLLFNLR